MLNHSLGECKGDMMNLSCLMKCRIYQICFIWWKLILNNRTIRKSIPRMIACVFALWTIKATPNGKFEIYKTYTFKFQVWCKLWLSYYFSVIQRGFTSFLILHNHIVQVPTGEGKSIIFGVMAIILAVLGFNLSLYSEFNL